VIAWAGFDTVLGRCAVAWGDMGIVGSQLPAGDSAALRRRIAQRFAGAAEAPPPPAVRSAIERIGALLEGRVVDLSDVELDLRGVSEFDARVYLEALRIPCGQTVTYGELARRVGAPDAAPAVGQAMARNPFAPIVPCHRVVAAGGRLGGFSAVGGVLTKRRMLAIEARAAGPQGNLF
jgi:methylated-DNA-[protein]-cysteine S-methyltransferase